MSAERTCDLCGSTASELLYEIDGEPIVRCRSCGLVFAGREPRPEALVALYDASYWEDPEQEGYEGYEAAEERKRHHFRTLLAELERHVAPGRMLEVGSAYGFFLDEARSRGWQVKGIEPSEHAARWSRDRFAIEVDSGPLSAMPVSPDSLDAVVLWDVIEHVPDPRRTLEVAHALLRRGGVVAVSTGDVSSLSARVHGRDWSLLTPPWHQFYFSRRTLRRLLEDVGFDVARIGGDGVVAVDPVTARPRVPRVLARVLLSRTVTTVARRAGRGMTMFVFARKR